MYILERTIGVLVYVFVCFIVCYYISYKMSDIRKLNKVLLIFNIILSIMAFLYVPAPSADLYRHYEELKVVSTYSFQEICDYIHMDLY